jgi:8-amino-7-oxononanoate synthase
VTTGPLRHLEGELDALARDGLRREPRATNAELLNLCSNDYLGFAADRWPLTDEPSGAAGSRLVTGTYAAHAAAEARLASWFGAESALLFSSGYAANVGVMTALARRGDVIVSDALNHASIVDGCRLSGATIVVAPHCDPSAVGAALAAARAATADARTLAEPGPRGARRWVVTESYFSMDGDSPNLPALRAACDEHDAALIVDEAHAIGVFGPAGAGLCAATGVHADVLVGTAGKALGLQGAFVAGSRTLRDWLWNRARSFVFSTGVSPSLAAAIDRRARRVMDDESARTKLAEVAARLRADVGTGRYPVLGYGPIMPILIGDAAQAVALSTELRELGVAVQAIRYPTVPANSARLRVTASARLSDVQLTLAGRAFRRVLAA